VDVYLLRSKMRWVAGRTSGSDGALPQSPIPSCSSTAPATWMPSNLKSSYHLIHIWLQIAEALISDSPIRECKVIYKMLTVRSLESRAMITSQVHQQKMSNQSSAQTDMNSVVQTSKSSSSLRQRSTHLDAALRFLWPPAS
jgi:hypothetical protein